MAKIRLDRAVSKLGLASRTEARRLIAGGLVTVAGRTVRDPGWLVLPDRAAIAVGGRETTPQRWRTIAFHKPRGVVTTRHDPEGRPTVFDVLGKEAVSLVAVGRLDLASTGLLLLTTDRELANALTDPQRRVARRYVVTVRGEVADADAARLVRGIGDLRAASVTVRKRSRRETHLIVELTEGRNRGIRRLFAAIRHEVTRLLRVAYGPVELGDLQPGQWREVSRDEMADFVAADAEKVATRSEAPGSDRLPSRGAPGSGRQHRRPARAGGRRRPA